MKENFSKKLCLCAILAALSTVSFIIENLFPAFILPGAKIGISNIFILFSLISLGYGYSFAIVIVKVLLGSIFSGNFSAILYSLPAGIISLTAECIIVYFINKTSIIAISIIGGVVNNIIQNIVFCLVTDTMQYLSVLPYLALLGILSGLIVGITVFLLVKKIPMNKFLN